MKPGKLLIVDDEKDIRSLMEEIFLEEGYQVETAANGVQAQQAWRSFLPDVLFLDVWMPDIDGISLLKQMQEEQILDNTKVIMMSGHGTIETAIEATKLGAYDFLEKPLSLAKLIVTAERAIEYNQLNQENRQLKQKQPDHFMPIGKSKAVVQLRETIERLTKFTMPILVTGESGTGKHHFAEALHKTSLRKKNPYAQYHALDFNQLCLPENLEKLKKVLRESHQGTMVISNIEQLSKEAQAQISNIVLNQCYKFEESADAVCLDIRVIALTKHDLEAEVNKNQFREDLYQRLKVMQIHIPALRQHTEDIPELIEYYVDHFVTFEGLDYRHFSVSAQNILRQHNWPGNLKELKNHIQRLLILGSEEVSDDEVKELLTRSQTSSHLGEVVDTSFSLKTAKDNFEGRYLSQLLRETSGNVTETAKRSGVDRTNLYRKLKALGIDPKNPQ